MRPMNQRTLNRLTEDALRDIVRTAVVVLDAEEWDVDMIAAIEKSLRVAGFVLSDAEATEKAKRDAQLDAFIASTPSDDEYDD